MQAFGVDGSDQLHLCSDHGSESDPDVVFDKNMIFLSFLLKMLLLNFTLVLWCMDKHNLRKEHLKGLMI